MGLVDGHAERGALGRNGIGIYAIEVEADRSVVVGQGGLCERNTRKHDQTYAIAVELMEQRVEFARSCFHTVGTDVFREHGARCIQDDRDIGAWALYTPGD